jgi:hypothetical protein
MQGRKENDIQNYIQTSSTQCNINFKRIGGTQLEWTFTPIYAFSRFFCFDSLSFYTSVVNVFAGADNEGLVLHPASLMSSAILTKESYINSSNILEIAS